MPFISKAYPAGGKVMVTGSRNWDDYGRIYNALKHHRPSHVVVGDARGADALTIQACNELGIPVEVHRADWKTHGRAAGPKRNKAMVDQNPDYVLAFPQGGRGTANAISQARRAGIPVRTYGGRGK